MQLNVEPPANGGPPNGAVVGQDASGFAKTGLSPGQVPSLLGTPLGGGAGRTGSLLAPLSSASAPVGNGSGGGLSVASSVLGGAPGRGSSAPGSGKSGSSAEAHGIAVSANNQTALEIAFGPLETMEEQKSTSQGVLGAQMISALAHREDGEFHEGVWWCVGLTIENKPF